MKEKIILILFLIIGINYSQAQEKNIVQEQNNGIKLIVFEYNGPSLAYQITSDKQTEIEIQIKNIDEKLIRSERVSVTNDFISKINVCEVMKSDFFIVLLKDNKEIIRKKLIQNNK